MATSQAVLLMKNITMQLLLRFASLHQTGNDLQEDPTTRGLIRAIEQGLKPLNIGPSYAWKKSASREHWRSTVDTATLKEEYANEETERES